MSADRQYSAGTIYENKQNTHARSLDACKKQFPAVIARHHLRSELKSYALHVAFQEFVGSEYGGSFRQKPLHILVLTKFAFSVL